MRLLLLTAAFAAAVRGDNALPDLTLRECGDSLLDDDDLCTLRSKVRDQGEAILESHREAFEVYATWYSCSEKAAMEKLSYDAWLKTDEQKDTLAAIEAATSMCNRDVEEIKRFATNEVDDSDEMDVLTKEEKFVECQRNNLEYFLIDEFHAFTTQNSNKTFCDKGFSSEVDYKTFASIVDVVRTFEMDAREKQLSDIQVRLGALREIQAPARASGNGDRPWATPVPEPESNAASAMLGLFLLGVICGGVVYWVRKNRMAEIEAERAPPVDPNAITENPEEHEELSLVA